MINRGHMVLYGPVRDFRRQYADHAVMVHIGSAEGQGSPPESVPGVRGVEPVAGEWKLLLEPHASPQSVLAELVARGVVIESFSVASLPLEDVFVKVVREGLGLDHGQSGPPVPEETSKGGGR
jgi:ABC-type uncharacterized transport system ATPase subunit